MFINYLEETAKNFKTKWQYFEHYQFHNFVFIHINKTAGRSIRKALNIPFEHKTAAKKIAELGESEWNRRFTFSFVRNPWDRTVSLYSYRVKTNQSNLKVNPINFKDWVKLCFLDNNPDYYDEHKMFMPQLDWLSDNQGKLAVDFVGRFDNLNDDFQTICSRIGKKANLPHLNPSKRDKYRNYYDDETRNIIKNYYEKDIEFFKYDF